MLSPVCKFEIALGDFFHKTINKQLIVMNNKGLFLQNIYFLWVDTCLGQVKITGQDL